VRASSDGFVRIGGVDYSVPAPVRPPPVGGARVAGQIIVFCDGEQIAAHDR
jgi:hypothetical protein